MSVVTCFGTHSLYNFKAEGNLEKGELLQFAFYSIGGEPALLDENAVLRMQLIARKVRSANSIILSGRHSKVSLYVIPIKSFPHKEKLCDAEFATEIENTLRALSTRIDWDNRPKPLIFVKKETADDCLRLLHDYVEDTLALGVGVAFVNGSMIEHRHTPVTSDERRPSRPVLRRQDRHVV